MVCHGELANDRPGTQHLTEFYLCLSVGGALGGLFNALLAPMLFNTIIEYPLMVVIACLQRPGKERANKWDFVIPLIIFLLLGAILRMMHLKVEWNVFLKFLTQVSQLLGCGMFEFLQSFRINLFDFLGKPYSFGDVESDNSHNDDDKQNFA